MSYLTISIFGNKIFSEIINELQLFSKFKIGYYDDLSLCVKNAIKHNELVILFITELNIGDYEKVVKNDIPLIAIIKPSISKNLLSGKFVEKIKCLLKY